MDEGISCKNMYPQKLYRYAIGLVLPLKISQTAQSGALVKAALRRRPIQSHPSAMKSHVLNSVDHQNSVM